MDAPVLHVSGRILLGPEEIVDEMWVVGGRITFEAPTTRGADIQEIKGWVIPGLVDAHCHVGLDSRGAVEEDRAIEQALTDRDAGTLLIRDAGSPLDTSFIQEREDLPELIRAGRHIARTRRYIPNFAHEIEPADLVAYVRQEAARSDGWVKLVGDWIDREQGDLGPCWPVSALRLAVEAAHEGGARVTAHCFGEQSLVDFAAAGVDCIEHATGLVPDTIDTFAEQQIAIVPTLVNIGTFPDIAAAGEKKYPGYAAHMRDLHARRYDTIGAAHEAGVPIFCGTDAGGSLPHGLVAQEIAELAKAGMTNTEAVGAASWTAREWLGREGIVEGASADVVVYREDPRADLSTLADPRAIVLRGAVVL